MAVEPDIGEKTPYVGPRPDRPDPPEKRSNEKLADNADEPLSRPSSHTTYATHTPNVLPRQLSFRASEDRDREQALRLNDDLELLRAEHVVSHQQDVMQRLRSRQGGGPDANAVHQDTFHEMAHGGDSAGAGASTAAPANKNTDAVLYRFWMWLKKVPRFIRYFLYMAPGAVVLLAPVLLGYYRVGGDKAAVGGRYGPDLMWFGIWLEIVWCSLWATRMVASIMPHLFRGIARIAGSYNARKWHDIGRNMELHLSLFAWWLAILVSFTPIMNDHRAGYPDGNVVYMNWIDVVNKVIIAIFVLAALNLVEKVCIQWIAAAFHQRTYATRIQNHKADMDNLVRLYEHTRATLDAREDAEWEAATHHNNHHATPPGARTPMRAIQETARTAFSTAFTKVGVMAKGFGNDFVGRRSVAKDHPSKVTAEMLRNQASSHALARAIYRALVRDGNPTVLPDDMVPAFGDDAERAEAAFAMFDKDLNGDISMDEFEQVCNEIQLEKKAIAASLKDLDSVIQKLDTVFLCVIVIIAIVVFVSIISASAAAGLASASTSILALSWVLQATAQEFLQSIIFVFIKHPFDVGDRVTVYGNTGAALKGDDYYVTEISLLYTEFKKMEGHIVQAPNSLLNTLFILNQRRSNGLADPVELRMRFGTPAWMIEDLKARMLRFCLDNKRDYQPRVITEVRTIEDVRATTVNFIFFHKSNFQNELLRLVRHNKFLAELQAQMVEVGIEGPMRTDPGGSREVPAFIATMAPPPAYPTGYHNQYPGNDVLTIPVPENVPVTAQAVAVEDPVAPPSLASGAATPPPNTTTTTTATGLHHTSSYGTRPRSRSRAESVSPTYPTLSMQPIVEERMSDFQDVFETRRDVSRIANVRERFHSNSASHTESPDGGAVAGVSTTTGLEERVGMAQSLLERVSSRRLLGRLRRGSQLGRDGGHDGVV